MSLRIIFMGTPEFSVPALHALHKAGYQIVAVYSQPPRPSGRGHKVVKGAVHQAAEELHIPVYTPVSLKNPDVIAEFKALKPDVAVVSVYGLILPVDILEAPRYGCINIHASLLPRWRGAAPIHRAILAGDKQTGVTIMQMDKGLDTGDMLLQDIVPITMTTTTSELFTRLSIMGSHLLLQVLQDMQKGNLQPQVQPEQGVTYANKLTREEGELSWFEDAHVLERKVRALNPWPGVWFSYKGERIKVLEAEVAKLTVHGKPGDVLDDLLTIACGVEALRLNRLQKSGGKVLSAREFINGNPIKLGDHLI